MADAVQPLDASLESLTIHDMATVQKRMCLWHPPRTCSCAFMRAMMNRKSCKVFMEPYAKSYFYGTDRETNRYSDTPPEEMYSYTNIRKKLEEPYPDYSEVFTKNCASLVVNHISSDYLPEGYTHTFLLRHPDKAIVSLYHSVCVDGALGPNQPFNPQDAGYKEVYGIHQYITQVLGQPSIVVDADDLCNKPEATLRAYCKAVDIPFEKEMLEWKEDDINHPEFMAQYELFFTEVKKSRSFFSGPSESRKKFAAVESLPAAVQEFIKECIPYYEKVIQYKLII